MANKGSITASGTASGGGISGKVSGRPLGKSGEKTYMSATGTPKNYMNHQVTCSGGCLSVKSNKGQAWKMDGRSSKKPGGPSIRAFMNPSNYKDRQRNGK